MTMVEVKQDRFASVRPLPTVPTVTTELISCEKAAIVIMALDGERSKRLVSSLTEDEVRRLTPPWPAWAGPTWTLSSG